VHYKNDPENLNSISNSEVKVIYKDNLNRLWIGTSREGLNCYDQEANTFRRFVHDPRDPATLGGNHILCIHDDQKGNLWIGTAGSGLDRMNLETGEITHYSMEQGLPNNIIYGILQDDREYLWISSNKGLSKFDQKKSTFKNYHAHDGLQSNEFNAGAYHKGRNGELFFGGINGLNVFSPDSLRDDPNVPNVVITDFLIFNKPVSIGEEINGRVILKKSITETEEIHLSYRENVITIEFSGLFSVAPKRNEYAYMMVGMEKQWNYVGGRRFATYTNLPPGNLTFRVKASNKDGIWNEKATNLSIIISPPLWKTLWFKLLLVVSLASIIVFTHKLRTYQIRRRSEELENIIENMNREIAERKKAEKAQEESEEKIRDSLKEKDVLLKEIHHRVKNNLQVIASMFYLESQYTNEDKIAKKLIECQDRVKSFALVHEQLYKSENLASIDFTTYAQKLINNLMESYMNMMESIEVMIESDDLSMSVDKAIPCGLIINELVSNSFKHAFPDGRRGWIRIKVLKSEEIYVLSVKDNGIGIPDEVNIFEIDSMGMNIIRALTRQIHGEISLSKINGTEVTIEFHEQ